jgi:hypothetical protein
VDDADAQKGESAQTAGLPSLTIVTTKSGRASKPSTPAMGNFPEPLPRSKNTRNTASTAAKRSHKKGGAPQAVAAQAAEQDENGSAQDDEDADELRYCYCNGVSYGEMVACDADTCEREWFHLDCVGLKAAPGANSKFYTLPPSSSPFWGARFLESVED